MAEATNPLDNLECAQRVVTLLELAAQLALNGGFSEVLVDEINEIAEDIRSDAFAPVMAEVRARRRQQDATTD